jgi:uncharacterized protein (TIGR02391 family)
VTPDERTKQIKEAIESLVRIQQFDADTVARVVAEKLRVLSGLTLDGSDLVNEALGTRRREGREHDPLVAFNSLRTLSEQSEHRGIMHLMKGVFALFRNPTAHELKGRWAVDERDALDLLTPVSVIHRRLESGIRVPSHRGGGR